MIQSLTIRGPYSQNHIPPLPAISPFLMSTDDSSDSETPDTPPSPTYGTPFTEMTLFEYSSSDHFTLDDSSRYSSSSSSSESSSDPSSDDLSDSSSKISIPKHISGMKTYSYLLFNCPSRKRSRSPTASIPLSLHIPGALSFAHADLFPSPKRIRSPESAMDLEVSSAKGFEPSRYRGTDLDNDERSDGIDIDPEIQAEIDKCIAYANALRVRGIDARVVVKAVDREEIEIVSYDTLGDLVQKFHNHTEEILVHHVQAIESVQRDKGYKIVATGQKIVDMMERIRELERDNRRLRDMMDVTSQRVTQSQRKELHVQREMRQIRRFRFYDCMRIARLDLCASRLSLLYI
ncbi:hypothetical protein Tco_1317574 [Tanacetum coccineum]